MNKSKSNDGWQQAVDKRFKGFEEPSSRKARSHLPRGKGEVTTSPETGPMKGPQKDFADPNPFGALDDTKPDKKSKKDKKVSSNVNKGLTSSNSFAALDDES